MGGRDGRGPGRAAGRSGGRVVGLTVGRPGALPPVCHKGQLAEGRQGLCRHRETNTLLRGCRPAEPVMDAECGVQCGDIVSDCGPDERNA